MTRPARGFEPANGLAALASISMIAHQVGGKAIRDALFFSTFPLRNLVLVSLVSLVPTILLALVAPMALRRYGPAATVRWAYLVSAALHLVEWMLLASEQRGPAAAMLYVHMLMVPVITAGFWALMSEGVDLRENRRRMAQVATTASVGGLLGALLAWKFDVHFILPLLAMFHLVCAAGTLDTPVAGWRRPRSPGGAGREPTGQSSRRFGGAPPSTRPYLLSLALTVAALATGAAVLDYYFKGQVQMTHPGLEAQKQFFAVFHLATALLASVAQLGFSELTIRRIGLANTVAMLPAVIVVGGMGILWMPGLWSATLVFGAERVVRNSLFRSAYEPLYNAVPARDKHSAKTVVDVGSERLGDAVGYSAALGMVGAGATLTRPWHAGLAMFVAVGAIVLARAIHTRYVGLLRNNVGKGEIQIDPSTVTDTVTQNILAEFGTHGIAKPAGTASPTTDSQFEALLSGDPPRVLSVLRTKTTLPPGLLAHVIPLLGDDDLAGPAIETLRQAAPMWTGFLVDHLLNTDTDLAVRRRIPRVLAACPTMRAAEGLLAGLDDARFELRLQCGRALLQMRERWPEMMVDEEAILRRVIREVEVERPVWVAHRHAVAADPQGVSPLLGEGLGRRADRSLEHVFNLLALVLPREPLRLALKALHTQTPALRGTALEYLEAVLPRGVRDRLWGFLEVESAPREPQSLESALRALQDQHMSVEIHLTALNRDSPRK